MTGIISEWSVGLAMAEPDTHFSRSAWLRRMPKLEASASVMSLEPIGIDLRPSSIPAEWTEILVTCAPISISATPSSRSSGVTQA